MSQLRNLLLVGLFGYLMGILFAPKRGSELREDLKDFVEEMQGRTSEAVSSVSNRGQELLDKAQPTIAKVTEEARHLQSRASSSFNDAVARSSAHLN